MQKFDRPSVQARLVAAVAATVIACLVGPSRSALPSATPRTWYSLRPTGVEDGPELLECSTP
eukprot:scaffold436695_cov37-Prasinocladus_malaysianus.AAC.1